MPAPLPFYTPAVAPIRHENHMKPRLATSRRWGPHRQKEKRMKLHELSDNEGANKKQQARWPWSWFAAR